MSLGRLWYWLLFPQPTSIWALSLDPSWTSLWVLGWITRGNVSERVGTLLCLLPRGVSHCHPHLDNACSSRYANVRVLYLHLGTYLSTDCLLCNSCSLKGSRKATYLQFIQLLSCHKSGSRALSSILPTWAEILSPSCLLKLKPTKKHSLSHSLSFSDHLILADLGEIYLINFSYTPDLYTQFIWIISWFQIIPKYLTRIVPFLLKPLREWEDYFFKHQWQPDNNLSLVCLLTHWKWQKIIVIHLNFFL